VIMLRRGHPGHVLPGLGNARRLLVRST
jgi:hypothetical protein